MIYQIDQSGKIEDTNRLTIVAVANGRSKILKISASEKQRLIKAMRALGYPQKTFIYKIFAGLIFLLLKNERIEEVVIDNEYPGHEATIKNIIIQLFQKIKIKTPQISFDTIGKQSNAHKAALEAFRGKRKIDITIKSKQVLELFYRK
ncbi:MAG: hypothetical protein A2815_00590 [Candidatus Portnoybacteria bacterium RIFCSPHIGHO2_01_FULL_40_12b]|uniref:RNase H type-1 domain-containing protein n=2 Tax=Candidatus Portnoyibacteriota TaxID=1817913 RepID=A0A1G2FD67_9BACT|nr:MAG: hypothetical protein A2815_00590 [Candidatus Portnoybacteria bacterium RIFCSPHIGHO2_01_FULL_40_12b]OGZ40271.1 MAG: hypothetical protein A3I20_02050 [Candidatus Portnoybacteria bacterium RIFCSPLOWO2_02_FULL_40_15]